VFSAAGHKTIQEFLISVDRLHPFGVTVSETPIPAGCAMVVDSVGPVVSVGPVRRRQNVIGIQNNNHAGGTEQDRLNIWAEVGLF
jgi:hypothetical protein